MVETGKTRLHSIESRSAFEPSSALARARSCGYSSKNPGPPDGGVPARCVEGPAGRPRAGAELRLGAREVLRIQREESGTAGRRRSREVRRRVGEKARVGEPG